MARDRQRRAVPAEEQRERRPVGDGEQDDEHAGDQQR